MKSFFNQRHTRYTAIVMLFVWMMTLGISFANACLVDIAPDHNESASHTQAIHLDDRNEHSLASGKAVCLKVCAAEQTTVVKSKPLDISSGCHAVPVLWASALTIPAVDPNDRSAQIVSSTWYERPVAIRLLRLTI